MPTAALGQPAIPIETKPSELTGQLATLLQVCSRLNQHRPAEAILEDVLAECRRLTGAEAGTVYVVDSRGLRFICCHNDVRSDLVVVPQIQGPVSLNSFKGKIIPIDSPSLAAYVARTGQPLRLDDVYAIPKSQPYQFDRTYDKLTGYRTVSQLVIPLALQGDPPIGVLQMINHRRPEALGGGIGPFTDDDQALAVALASMASIVVRNAQLQAEVHRLHLDTIFRLANAAEFRDSDTGAHIQRVSLYCETVARALRMPTEWCQNILFASPMHDVGKLGVPDAVLNKPGPLTDDERALMMKHTTIGAQILRGSQNAVLQMAERIALSHHEKWDGGGYPLGLKQEAIPLEGRITAVADVYDALTSRRVYKPPMSNERALEIMAKGRGSHFDPLVVDAFFASRESIQDIQEAYSGEYAALHDSR